MINLSGIRMILECRTEKEKDAFDILTKFDGKFDSPNNKTYSKLNNGII